MSDVAIETVGGFGLLFIMATEQEYGPELKARIRPLITGVGPVEAGVGTAAFLSRLGTEKKPDLLVSIGSAGSRLLEQGEVYQASAISFRDMDASPIGFEKGRTPFLELPAEIAIPQQIGGVQAARLSTGSNIVSGAAYDAIDAEMVDMEGFAVMRAGHHFAIPTIALKGISDGKDELHHFDDWADYLHAVDLALAKVIDRLEENVAAMDRAYWTKLPEGVERR
ncbi:5'-methylthioadenosine/S-adenosylhomocysteine nucleosidase [Afifella pfennigii]|uniref:5'-methylthioadenosine/S-adenosylhomocysteine nucleosidase n=1 Tax=Afifella pfennigii TaxID=209897 RepID=UPI00047B6968|nr:5'-methylthioadenosine/S-adenosylhomocysteine nucleosidase [Afifella pfennigii]